MLRLPAWDLQPNTDPEVSKEAARACAHQGVWEVLLVQVHAPHIEPDPGALRDVEASQVHILASLPSLQPPDSA